VHGPFSPDTVFVRASRGEFDAVIALYHDQATIPVKAIAFGSAVNVTLGLPLIRTSVDHGTAFDIAGQRRCRRVQYEGSDRSGRRIWLLVREKQPTSDRMSVIFLALLANERRTKRNGIRQTKAVVG
jgi:hypothetical protein